MCKRRQWKKCWWYFWLSWYWDRDTFKKLLGWGPKRKKNALYPMNYNCNIEFIHSIYYGCAKNVIRWGHTDQIYWLLKKIIFHMGFCLWFLHSCESINVKGLVYTQLFVSDTLLLSNGSVAVYHNDSLWSWVGVVLSSVKPGLKWARSGPWQMATSIWSIWAGIAILQSDTSWTL